MSDKITFSRLVEELAEKSSTSQTLSHDFISGLTEIVIDSAMNSGKSSITNFGSFIVVDVAARNGVNPRTGEPIVIPAHQRLSFSPYKALEKTVNAPFAHLEASVIEDENEKDSTSLPPETISTTSLAPAPSEEESKEEEVNEDNKELNTDDEKEKPEAPVFKRPGKEERKSGNLLNVVILIVVLLLVVAGLWYFIFRDTSVPPTVAEQQTAPPVEVPADPTPNPPPVVDQTSTNSDTPQEVPVQEESPAQQERVNVVDESSSEPVTYIVSRDEWIYDIARRTYSKPTFWPLIFKANFSVSQDPDLIIPGKTLTLPEIENPQNPTQNDRARLAAAHRVVSEAYANAGKSEQARNYERMAAKFSN